MPASPSPLLPEVNSTYGAPMGRSVRHPGAVPVKLLVISIDSQGYDAGGAYWGVGEPLWLAVTREGERAGIARGATREAALREMQVREEDVNNPPTDAPTIVIDPGAMHPILWSFLQTGMEMQHLRHQDEAVSEEREVALRPGLHEIPSETLREAASIVRKFMADTREDLEIAFAEGYDELQAGHDLWMEAVGAGVGFTDRDIDPEVAQRLSAAVPYRELEIFIEPQTEEAAEPL